MTLLPSWKLTYFYCGAFAIDKFICVHADTRENFCFRVRENTCYITTMGVLPYLVLVKRFCGDDPVFVPACTRWGTIKMGCVRLSVCVSVLGAEIIWTTSKWLMYLGNMSQMSLKVSDPDLVFKVKQVTERLVSTIPAVTNYLMNFKMVQLVHLGTISDEFEGQWLWPIFDLIYKVNSSLKGILAYQLHKSSDQIQNGTVNTYWNYLRWDRMSVTLTFSSQASGSPFWNKLTFQVTWLQMTRHPLHLYVGVAA